jgi:glycerate 2-kinase
MLELYFNDHLAHAQNVISAVLSACDPRALTLAQLARAKLGNHPVHTVAIGKGAVAMTMAAGDYLGPRLRFGVCTTQAHPTRPSGFPGVVGLMPVDHPIPSAKNLEAARAIRYVAQDFGTSAAAGSDAVLLVLISGGGSAHLALPAGDLTLDDLADVTGRLLKAGASIQELNCVRKHCESLKGGWLGALAAPGRVEALVLSDVIGDELDVIASGPCTPDPTTYKDAMAVLDRFNLTAELPRIKRHLFDGRAGVHEETPKPGDPRLASVSTHLIGSNAAAVAATEAALRAAGFVVVETRQRVSGEARLAGKQLAAAMMDYARKRQAGEPALLAKLARPDAPIALVWGGETTVTVQGDGVGGRNQELALTAAVELDGRPEQVVMTFATDGIDGPTDAAGAIVSGLTSADAAVAGLDARAALARNDSHQFFLAMEASGRPVLLRTGPTGTNVADVYVGLVY